MREISITGREEGQRLYRLLEKYLPLASGGFLHKMLRKKNIKLNEGKATGKEILKEGDRVQIYFAEETMRKFTREDSRSGKAKDQTQDHDLRSKVRILWASEDVIILHKPSGLLSQKAAKGDDSLNDWLIDYYLDQGFGDRQSLEWFRPSIANRLDRNTSGIVLAGLTASGLKVISDLIRNRNLEKYYMTVVAGIPKDSERESGYLKKDQADNKVCLYRDPVKGASYIETGYKVEGVAKADSLPDGKGKASLVRVRLYTGKSHQIRAHLSALGYPLLGDPKYGDRKWNRWVLDHCGVSSQLLHSCQLKIPEDQARLESQDQESYTDHDRRVLESLAGLNIKDPPPGKMRRVLKELGIKI